MEDKCSVSRDLTTRSMILDTRERLEIGVIVQILCRRVNCAMQDCGLLESNDQANTQNRYADKTNTVCPTTSSVLTPGECKDNSDSVVADVCGRSYADYPDGPLTTTCGHVPYTGQYIALFFSIHAQG